MAHNTAEVKVEAAQVAAPVAWCDPHDIAEDQIAFYGASHLHIAEAAEKGRALRYTMPLFAGPALSQEQAAPSNKEKATRPIGTVQASAGDTRFLAIRLDPEAVGVMQPGDPVFANPQPLSRAAPQDVSKVPAAENSAEWFAAQQQDAIRTMRDRALQTVRECDAALAAVPDPAAAPVQQPGEAA